jgi:hypothetical protein
MTEPERLCPLPHRVDPDRPRSSAPGSVLCRGHIAQARTALEQLPGRYDELGIIAAPSGEQRNGAQSADTPIPYREDAADHRGQLRGTLTSWALLVQEERGLTAGASTPAPADTCMFLRRHHDWSVSQPWADDYATELRDISERAWSILHPSGIRRVDVPVPCPVCAGPLVALVGQHDAQLQRDDLAPPTVQCDGCGTVIPFADAQQAATTGDRMVTWEVAVLWAQVQRHHRLPAATLRTWAARGQVATRKAERDTLYSLRDVERLLTPERVA